VVTNGMGKRANNKLEKSTLEDNKKKGDLS
jgi:hypothetical protein